MLQSRWLCLLLLLVAVTNAIGATTHQPIPYSHDGVELEGYLAIPEGQPRGAVLVVHEWWGLNDYAKKRTDMLAELGYVAFAVDMYGKGKVTDDPAQAGQWAGAVRKDQADYRARAMAGLDAFKKTGHIDGLKIGAIGYCFGGTTVLELAYGGADMAAVVAFHGNPAPPLEDDKINASIMICHGDADSLVSDESLDATTDALDVKGVDWLLIRYAYAKHAFTNPDADSHGMPPVAYNAKADKRSWEHMKSFFDELLASE